MDIRRTTAFAVFFTCGFWCWLVGQERIEGAQAGAGVDLAALEDVPAFLQARRDAIRQKIALIQHDFERHNQLPAGVATEIGQSFALIDGRVRPDLFDHGTVLGILFRQLNSSLRDKRVGGLMARGLRPDEVKALLSFIEGDDYPNAAQKRTIDHLNKAMAQPAKSASDEMIRGYLEASHEIIFKSVDAWATEVLKALPVRARRIIFAYAYEVVVPNSHMTQVTAFTRRDIEFYRQNASEK